jgi:hypothetical protein
MTNEGNGRDLGGQAKDFPMTDQSANPNYLKLAAEIVSAYVVNNWLPHNELPTLLRAVHEALNRTAAAKTKEPAPVLAPPVPIRKSVTPDYNARTFAFDVTPWIREADPQSILQVAASELPLSRS